MLPEEILEIINGPIENATEENLTAALAKLTDEDREFYEASAFEALALRANE